jgi:hypothetical protein
MTDKANESDYKLPDTWPGALAGFRNEVIYADTPEAEADIRGRVAYFSARGAETHEAARKLVTDLGIPTICPRAQCRRANACAARYVTCMFEHRELIQAMIAEIRAGATAELTPAPPLRPNSRNRRDGLAGKA